jgi:hypothetical protein
MHDGIRLTKNPCYARYPCTTQHDELVERHDVLKKKQAIYKVRKRDKWKKKKQTRDRERGTEGERACSDRLIMKLHQQRRLKERERVGETGERARVLILRRKLRQ